MGRPDSFDDVVLSQLPRIRAIGRGLLPRAADLDDFVQDVVVRVYLKRGQLRDDGRLPQWIASIASNAARTGRRSRPPLPVTAMTLDVASDPTPVEHVELAERWRQVIHALNELSDADRELLTAHYIDEVDREEARRRFGYSYTGLTTRLHRARGRLRRRLRGVLGLAVMATTGVARRVEAVASAPVVTGGGGAVVAHVALAGVVWLMIAYGRPDAGVGHGVSAPRASAVSLVASTAGERATPPRLALADGSDRHNAGDAGYAQLGDGQYLGASSPLFDYVGKDGLTIEAWYYFDEPPPPGERWALIRKEGSYLAEYWGPDVPIEGLSRWDSQPWDDPSFVHGTITRQENHNRGRLAGDRAPRGRWVHVGLQYYYSRSISFGPALFGRNGSLTYASSWHANFIHDGVAGGSYSTSMTSFRAPYYGRQRSSEGLAQLPRADTPLVLGASLSTASLGSPTAELLSNVVDPKNWARIRASLPRRRSFRHARRTR